MTQRLASIAFICLLFILFFIAFIILLKIAVPYKVEDSSYRISIGGISFYPNDGEINIDGAEHFIVQFRSIPSSTLLEQLAESGVSVGRYVGGNAYIAHTSKTNVNGELRKFSEIRSAMKITPEMRLQRELQNSPKFQEAIFSNEPVSIDVRFHEDVSFDRAVDCYFSQRTDKNSSPDVCSYFSVVA